MPTLEEVEREIKRRGLQVAPAPLQLSLEEVEREIARRKLPTDSTGSAPVPSPVGAAVNPAVTGAGPTPAQNPGLLSQLGNIASGLTGFSDVQQAVQESPQASGAMQALGDITGVTYRMWRRCLGASAA